MSLGFYDYLRKKTELEIDWSEIESMPYGEGIDSLVRDNFLSDKDAAVYLSEYLGVPFYEIDNLQIDNNLIEKISPALINKHKFLPVSLINGVLTVAISRPFDFYGLNVIADPAIHRKNYVIIPEKQLDNYLLSITARSTVENIINNISLNEQQILSSSESASDTNVLNAPTVKLVNSIIEEAIPLRASDIHVEPTEFTVRIRYRIDGSLNTKTEFPISSYSGICARLKIMAGINIAERRIPQDGRINMEIGGQDYDFRVSTLPTVYGEKFVIRILDKTSFNFTRSELGFTEQENKIVDRILAHPYGIMLMTGPTGCGKTTTLYSFLKELNKPDVNIITVEDPVEYTLSGVNQLQVNPKANLTFASALRSILRQDPNIIMIGEIRDEETAQIAIRAAITGHLVFSTLHTNDAPGTVSRLVDMDVPNYLVADAVVGVIAQRLVKRLCPQCRKPHIATAEEMKLLKTNEKVEIYEPQGCPFCNGTGYKGRTAVHEILYVTPEVRAAIIKGETADSLKKIAIDSGMSTLMNSCRNLVLEGVTDIKEMLSLMTE